MIYRHNRTTYIVIGSMQWNRESIIWKILSEPFNPWDNTTGRNRDSARWKIKFFLIDRSSYRLSYIIIVKHWFPHSHKYNISQPISFIIEYFCCIHDLFNNLMIFKITEQSKLSGCTKSTSHRTSCLTWYTQCYSTSEMTHDYWLNIFSSLCFEKNFCCLVIFWSSLFFYFKSIIKTMFIKKFSSLLWKRLNIIKVCYKVFINSIFYLSIAKWRLLMLFQKVFEFYFFMDRKFLHFVF